jgi:hypothetical protein
MVAIKKFKRALSTRPDPSDVLAIAAQTAPSLPPARLTPAEPIGQLNLKVKASLIDQLAERANAESTSQKAIVCRALSAAGFAVHPDDLEDRTSHRRRRLRARE